MRADLSIARLRIATGPGAAGGLVTARALVEDALRTEASAAGPAAARGLLVLRRLDAGRVRAQSDRTAAQRRVNGALAEAGRRALHPLDPGAADADAVLFRDPLEAYALYAEALFRRSPLLDAWFFRAIFGHRHGLPVADAGRRLLLRAAEEPFAPLAIAEVVMRAGPVALPLVRSLSLSEARATLKRIAPGERFHGPQVEPSLHQGARESVASVEGSALRRLGSLSHRLRTRSSDAVRSLGEQDPRARLIVAALLIEAGTAPVSQGLTARVTRALARSVFIPAPPTGSPQVSPARLDPEACAGLPAHSTEPVIPNRPQRTPRTTRALQQPSQRNARTRAEPFELDRPAPSRPEPSARHQQSDRSSASPIQPPPAKPDADSRASEIPPAAVEEPAGRADNHAPPAASDPPAVARLPWGKATAWAGAVLVASAIDRALLALVATPEAMDADLGRVILDRALARAGCSARDPARKAFAPADPASRIFAAPAFHLPVAFEAFGTGNHTLHRIEGRPGWRALTCRRGRIVLAAWHGRAPAAVRTRLDGARISRGPSLAEDPAPAILRTAELTLRAWLHGGTDYRIADVLRRSGWVRATRSHLDVTFDAALVDLRIRRAGLDLDAGWCPWLFRVVSIHYDYGGCDA